MKRKTIVNAFLALMCLALSGCGDTEGTADESGEENVAGPGTKEITLVSMEHIREEAAEFGGSYEGLDFENASFSIPEADTVVEVSYQLPSSLEEYQEIEDGILSNMKRMAGEASTDNLYYMNWSNSDVLVPMSEVSDEEKISYDTLSYNDGTYMSNVYAGGFYIQISDNALWTELSGMESFDEGGMILINPYYANAALAKSYSISGDELPSTSYELLDGEETIAEAIEFVEEEIKNYKYVSSQFMDFKVYRVDVYQLSTGEYYYDFYLKATVDGIDISNLSDKYYSISDAENVGFSLGSTYHQVTMAYKDQISFIWALGDEYSDVEEQEFCEFISLDDAAQIVSESLETEDVYKISDVTLAYNLLAYDVGTAPGHRELHLTYQFCVSNAESFGYEGLYFEVDAVTGECYMVVKEPEM